MKLNFSPVNLCNVYLIIRLAKKPRREEGKFFCPYNNYAYLSI